MSLREEGILILGSGNVVHNLCAYVWGDSAAPAFDWAVRFENRVRQLVLTGDAPRVVDYHSLGPDALLAVPTPEHYLPLLYLLGLRKDNEPISFPVEGVEGGSVSMFAVRVG
jgi:4,5-DOPA dioxygenase extradiol